MLRTTLDKVISRTLIVIMALMIINVLWQVATRFLLKDPSSFTEELARYLLIWTGLLGAAYAVGKKIHLAIDLLPTILKGKKQKSLQVIINGFIILFSLFVFIIGGIRLVYITFLLGQLSPALQVPLAYVYLIVPISGICMVVYSLLNIIDDRNNNHIEVISN
ncbi:MAG: TRAP transporter small permease [Cyclobacteriaceae bacterium]|nr:TRAP transporter small permease [Cyclobacteriaceae bacterium]